MYMCLLYTWELYKRKIKKKDRKNYSKEPFRETQFLMWDDVRFPSVCYEYFITIGY